MAKNQPQIDIGQSGGAFMDNSNTYTPPTGKVVVAINAITDTKFATNGLIPSNTTGSYHIGSSVTASAAGNGTNAIAIATGGSGTILVQGAWLYGRWSSVILNSGTVAIYFGDA